MHRILPLFLLLAALGLAGCDRAGDAGTGLPRLEAELAFTLPAVPDGPTSSSVSEGPARATGEIDFDDPYDLDVPPTQIYRERTRVEIDPDNVFAIGQHDYIGNVGEIETTVTVAYESQHLGSFTAEKRQTNPFIADFGRVKAIWAWARVFTDHTCGLRGEGWSRHGANWEFFQGATVPEWGGAVATSQAEPKTQDPCQRRTGQSMNTEEQAGGLVCTYLITYDLDTGEILAWERLFCSSTGGTAI